MAYRVAVVEDDPAIRSMLKTVLALDGYAVSVFGDGKRAIDGIRLGHFQAVLLDIMLPGWDGISVLREIRASPGLEQIPVVILTAKTDEATTWSGWQAGCDWFLTKPIDPEEIVKVLRRLLGRPSGAGEVAHK